jgi:hypothetical protein
VVGDRDRDSGTLKVKEPDTYHRDRRKLRAFLTQVKLNIKLKPKKFTTQAKTVMYALTFLRNGAFNWFEPKLTNYLHNTT